LLGHEGENSLLSYLKSRNLALALSCGPDHELYGMSTMELNITLTKKGLQNVDSVIEAIFQYTQRLHEMGPQDYVFNEVNDLGKINFDFAEKGRPMGTVTNVAKRMQIFDDSNISEIFRCAYIRKTFDKEFNKKVSEVLIDPT
jgi:secreted Zn-dependent insulinase-like peptidase